MICQNLQLLTNQATKLEAKAEPRTLVAEALTLEAEAWTLEAEVWTLEASAWTLEAEISRLKAWFVPGMLTRPESDTIVA